MKRLYQFKSYRSRLLFLLLGLLAAVLLGVFYLVNQANIANARLHLAETLEITASSFAKDLQYRERILTDKVRLLSWDFPFKRAFATHERETILDTLENLRDRLGANVMMIAGIEGALIADTLHPEARDNPAVLDIMVNAAMQTDHGEASAIQMIDGVAYQMVVVPLYTPAPSAWILIGFTIDDAFTHSLQENTHSEVSLFYRHDAQWQLISSTLSPGHRQALGEVILSQAPQKRQTLDVKLEQQTYLTLMVQSQQGVAGEVVAVLQRSLSAALEPYMRLRRLMLGLFGIVLVLASIGIILMARGLSKPIELLVKTAQRIELGDYTRGVEIKRADEIGVLAHTFNSMVGGLAERDRVQSLLGKVVSREIADELLSKRIELGGEEREITVLFSDIRNFTGLCETMSPSDMLMLLNRYLTCMSHAIEAQSGVIDKYIGDAIMALFGAPIAQPESPVNAVQSALAMVEELAQLNQVLAAEGSATLAIGIGINTGVVVAGNMGSRHRLNYTVIGDGVNLASRLESLTKKYGVSIIVSESTRQACPNVPFRELDKVRVKGKKQPVAIFEPVPDIDPQRLVQHQQALDAFFKQQWEFAARQFLLLSRKPEDKMLYTLYLERIQAFQEQPPPAEWDGVITYSEK